MASFVYASRGHVPDYMVKGGQVYRFVSDHLGSVRAVVNANDGSVVQALEYDAWGVVVGDTNPGWQPFGFAGGLYEAATGLVRYGARDYDARVGRWTAKDPIGFGGGENLYVYANSNPVSLVDVTGATPAVPYPDPLTAVVEAFAYIERMGLADDIEWAGHVWRDSNGDYYHSIPWPGVGDHPDPDKAWSSSPFGGVSSECADRKWSCPTRGNPDDIIYSYHTHPDYVPGHPEEDPSRFSAWDILEAEGGPLGLPPHGSFLATWDQEGGMGPINTWIPGIGAIGFVP